MANTHGLYDVAIDGRPHLFKSGVIAIKPNTFFCVDDVYLGDIAYRPNLGRTYLYDYMVAEGQREQINGASRITFSNCVPSPNTVVIHRTLSPMKGGVPYRLEWIAEQGESRIAVVLQRDARDPQRWPIHLTEFTKIGSVIFHDGDGMSKLLANQLFKKGDR